MLQLGLLHQKGQSFSSLAKHYLECFGIGYVRERNPDMLLAVFAFLVRLVFTRIVIYLSAALVC